MSRIRTNIITNRMANGAPTVSNGLVISGITTTSEIFVGNTVKLDPVSGISTFAGNVDINADIDVDGHTNLDNVIISGVVTAAQFKGDGSQLSGLASREFYGFKTVNEDLILIHTNNGADNISKSDFESFEDSMTAPSGLSFTINSAGELEMTI